MSHFDLLIHPDCLCRLAPLFPIIHGLVCEFIDVYRILRKSYFFTERLKWCYKILIRFEWTFRAARTRKFTPECDHTNSWPEVAFVALYGNLTTCMGFFKMRFFFTESLKRGYKVNRRFKWIFKAAGTKKCTLWNVFGTIAYRKYHLLTWKGI